MAHTDGDEDAGNHNSSMLRGVGINFDHHLGHFLGKNVATDETIKKLAELPASVAHEVHSMFLRSDGAGWYEMGAGNSQGEQFRRQFHHYANLAGRVGLRVWGHSKVEVNRLRLRPYPPAPVWGTSGGPETHLVGAAVGFSGKGSQIRSDVDTDLRQFATAIEQRRGPRQVRQELFLDGDASQSKLDFLLATKCQHGRPEDLLIVYLRGHGVQIGPEEYFLLSSTRRLTPYEILTNGLDLAALVNRAARARHRLVLVIVDAPCDPRDVGPAAKPLFATSSEADAVLSMLRRQSSRYEFADDNLVLVTAAGLPRPESRSSFTQAVCDGLLGAADRPPFGDSDGRVTLGELVNFLIGSIGPASDDRLSVVVSTNWRRLAHIELTS